MKIQIAAYGIMRDIVGGNSLELDVKNEARVSEVLESLFELYPDAKRLTSLLLAVNEEYAEKDQVINEGDELVLIPPVSGG